MPAHLYFDDNEKAKLIALYNEGLSIRQISAKMGRGTATVHRWLHILFDSGELEEHSPAERNYPKKGGNAFREYDHIRRIELSNKIFNLIENLIDNTKDIKALKDAMIMYGIAEDKRVKLDPSNDASLDIHIDSWSDTRLEILKAIDNDPEAKEKVINALERTRRPPLCPQSGDVV